MYCIYARRFVSAHCSLTGLSYEFVCSKEKLTPLPPLCGSPQIMWFPPLCGSPHYVVPLHYVVPPIMWFPPLCGSPLYVVPPFM